VCVCVCVSVFAMRSTVMRRKCLGIARLRETDLKMLLALPPPPHTGKAKRAREGAAAAAERDGAKKPKAAREVRVSGGVYGDMGGAGPAFDPEALAVSYIHAEVCMCMYV
jgi:hypothetical protein